MENLSKELYSHHLFHEWANKEHLFCSEEYLLTKYLKDTTKRVVEAGTGGGRIIFFVEKMGFSNLEAFDFIPRFIDHATSLATKKNFSVRFTVADAAKLDVYQDESFDYLIYLQQVLCFLPEDQFLAGVQEAYRVARNDSLAIFSFLNWDSRKYNSALSLLVNLMRRVRNERTSKHHLPYLTLNNRPNFRLLNRNQATVFWVKKENILTTLKRVGFSIVEVKTEKEIDRSSTAHIVYVVCKKTVSHTWEQGESHR